MKSILALDISIANTGWAFGFTNEKPQSGSHRFAPKDATDDEVMAAACRWANDHVKFFNPDIVAIEAPIMSTSMGGGQSNAHTIFMLWSLSSIVRTVVKLRRPGAAQLVNAQSARKFFVGRARFEKGEAKPAVMARCVQLGWVPDDEKSTDRCDALCVWAYEAGLVDKDFASNLTPLGTSNVVPIKREVA